MRAATLTEGPPRQQVVVDTGDALVQGLTHWANEQQVGAPSFAGVGAFRKASLGHLQRRHDPGSGLALIDPTSAP